jgi:hypothetical protein
MAVFWGTAFRLPHSQSTQYTPDSLLVGPGTPVTNMIKKYTDAPIHRQTKAKQAPDPAH